MAHRFRLDQVVSTACVIQAISLQPAIDYTSLRWRQDDHQGGQEDQRRKLMRQCPALSMLTNEDCQHLISHGMELSNETYIQRKEAALSTENWAEQFTKTPSPNFWESVLHSPFVSLLIKTQEATDVWSRSLSLIVEKLPLLDY